MPETTPQQKIERVKLLGKDFVEIIIKGDSFDESNAYAVEFSKNENLSFIHPFDDKKIIEGQATVGVEILEELNDIDYIFVPVGGGGLASGIISIFLWASISIKRNANICCLQ